MEKKTVPINFTIEEVCHVSLGLGIALAWWHQEKRSPEEFEMISQAYAGVIQKLTRAVEKREAGHAA